MNIRFLGTGFGQLISKKKNTKDFRRPSSLLIDERILIDPTEKTFEFLDDFSLTGLLRRVQAILVTAADPAHISPTTLLKLAEYGKQITVYGEETVASFVPKNPMLLFHPIRKNEIFDAMGSRAIALPTLYKTETEAPAIGYAICTDRSLLYLPYGGFLHPDAWELLKKLRFDHAILGCSEGDRPSSSNTVQCANFELARMLRSIFLDAKMLSTSSRFFLTSIPMERKRSVHDDLVALSKNEGFTVSYDGLFMTV